MNILADLRYVQVVADTALTDTRIYCREIIEVDHGDWFRDTLLTHKEIIEELFGLIRFETGAVKTENSRGSKQVRYALLTESQTGFVLVLSRNTKKSVRKKGELIAEFEVAKAYRRTQLEAQFQAPAHTAPAFNYPAAQLQSIAGYASLSYTKTAIRRDFVVGLHYLERGREMVLTEVCFALAVNGSRSRAGVDLQNCPDIQISIKDAIAHHNAKAANKQNARLGRSECDGQLSFW